MAIPAKDSPPVVLVLGGHDPTGGAGVHADSEAIAAHGAHGVTLVTALTAQDTHGVEHWWATDPGALRAQARRLLADVAVRACKVGLVPTPEVAAVVREILAGMPRVPLVLDPVLASGRGDPLGRGDEAANLGGLLPRVDVLTPNSGEARRLGGSDDLDAACARLSTAGPEWVLVTGGHETGAEVENRVWRHGRLIDVRSWPRLPHGYHGSGCTLAAAIAALLARGLPPLEAMGQAQAYTWETLRRARVIGGGQRLPHRLYAMETSP